MVTGKRPGKPRIWLPRTGKPSKINKNGQLERIGPSWIFLVAGSIVPAAPSKTIQSLVEGPSSRRYVTFQSSFEAVTRCGSSVVSRQSTVEPLKTPDLLAPKKQPAKALFSLSGPRVAGDPPFPVAGCRLPVSCFWPRGPRAAGDALTTDDSIARGSEAEPR
jgi:hypothetical protein